MGKQARRPYLGDELFRSLGTSGFLLAAFTIPGYPELAIVKEERDILKKAIAIFSQTGKRSIGS